MVATFSDWRLRTVACIALALVAMAYWPGLAGPFLFDDYANLDDLGAYGPIDNWTTFLYYITSGTADPTGRPVALLSFLIDAQNWPADPWPFKRTNLLIHLLNVVLVMLVVSRLQTALTQRRPGMTTSEWTPLFAAVLWGAHPYLVSTTLYVVQREALLAATFVFLALLAWMEAVRRSEASRPLAAWMWAVFGFGGLTLLAGLSKANGFLAPMLAGLTYTWWMRPQRDARNTDRMAMLVLGLPSAIIAVYLLQYAWALWSIPYLHGRDWTLPERLLSQPRALWTYMFQLALPRAGGGGLYVDDFVASRGWLEPATTLPAAIALLASIAAAIVLRSRFPVVSLTWLFFLVAHLLESSVIALELYFEHRNYLPAALLGWPVAHFLLRPGAYRRYRLIFAALFVSVLLLLSHQRASVWGDEALITGVSAAHRTDSLRAQVQEANRQADLGNVQVAIDMARSLQIDNPASVIAAINAIAIECQATGALSSQTLARSIQSLESARNWNYGLYTWFADAATSPRIQQCRGFGIDGLRHLIDAGMANPRNAGNRRRRDFLHAHGRVELAVGNAASALDRFNAALELDPDPEYALVQAAALGNAGFQTQAIMHLDDYLRLESLRMPRVRDMRSLHRWLLIRTGYYRREIDILRRRMVADSKEP